MRYVTTAVLALALALPLAGTATAKPALRDVAEIDNGLMYLAIADRLRKDCGNIGARMIRALSYAEALKDAATERGYSNAEIDDYVTSKSEKRRMEAKATSWLASKGVSPDQKAGFCAFGVSEINRGSQIGQLLRER
ncbi:DUF5333 domain-containing protein [Pseudaestuariivita sp.]|uniref:DUF5333 domain-containing protein n=1 Tax=Pseudaestuariivita sp. TaxID=2211669 RepID=UPI0040580C4F